MIYARIIAGLFTLLFSISALHAADHWEFRIVNKSKLVADGFRTMENGQWSENWLHSQIAPGSDWTMDFGHSDGTCTVRTQVTFTDDTFFDYDVDYCKAKTLFVFERSMKYQ